VEHGSVRSMAIKEANYLNRWQLREQTLHM
jgi:hypothetical protein